MVAIIDILILLKVKETNLVLKVADLVANRDFVSLAEICSLLKMAMEVGYICFNFGFCHNFIFVILRKGI